jgi:hypothetical protein
MKSLPQDSAAKFDLSYEERSFFWMYPCLPVELHHRDCPQSGQEPVALRHRGLQRTLRSIAHPAACLPPPACSPKDASLVHALASGSDSESARVGTCGRGNCHACDALLKRKSVVLRALEGP